jgi:polysaccharide biosynthesis protein PslH
MKILFVSAVTPFPLYSGGQIRIYNLLRNLSKIHEITLFTFIRNESERIYSRQLNFVHQVEMFYRGSGKRLKYISKSVVGKYPLLLTTYDNSLMYQTIKQSLTQTKYDLVHIEPFYVYPVLPKLEIPLVVAEHNVEYEVYGNYAKASQFLPKKILIGLEAKRMEVWEKSILAKANQIIAVSEDDQRKIVRFSGNTNISVVPNGIDPNFFKFNQKSFSGKTKKFMFVGDFKWLPNRELFKRLLTEIWPGIKKVLPDATLHIIGRNIPNDNGELKLNDISLVENVTDIREAYREYDVMLAPVAVPGGSKYKILEAMASGLAVVTSQQGAAGINVVDKKHMIIAKSPSDYAKIASSIYNDSGEWRQICVNARKLVESENSWDKIAPMMTKVWEKAVYEK